MALGTIATIHNVGANKAATATFVEREPIVAVFVVVACIAVMLTSVSAVTSDVVTISVAEVTLAGMVSTGGTAATAGLLLVISSSTPPAGAGPVSVIVAVTSFVPTIDCDASMSEASVTGGGWSVTVVERVTPCRALSPFHCHTPRHVQ